MLESVLWFRRWLSSIKIAVRSFTSKILGGTATECDLVASVVQGGAVKGYLYHPTSAVFVPGDASAPLSDGALRALAAVAGQEVTYTCVPPGSGMRLAEIARIAMNADRSAA